MPAPSEEPKHQARAAGAAVASGAALPPPRSAAPDPLSDRRAAAEVEARIVAEALTPSALTSVFNLGNQVTALGVKMYLDKLVGDSTKTTDPIERMIVEQLAIAHHRLVALHAQAAAQKDLTAIDVVSAAATRLSSEFRRLTEALRKYRAPEQHRSTVIHRIQHLGQQNVVTAGSQAVQYVDAGAGGSHMKSRDTKLNSHEGRFADAGCDDEESSVVSGGSARTAGTRAVDA